MVSAENQLMAARLEMITYLPMFLVSIDVTTLPPIGTNTAIAIWETLQTHTLPQSLGFS